VRIALVVLFLTACSNDMCGEPEAVERIEIVTGEPPVVVEENGIVPYVRGGQGLMMAILHVAYAAPELEPCFEREVTVRSESGATILEAYPIASAALDGELFVEPVLQVIEPPFGDLVVEVEAGGASLTRTVDPTYPPSFSTLTGPTTATAGTPFEMTLELTHRAPQPLLLRVVTEPEAVVAAPDAIEYGEDGATLTITAETTGPLSVTVEDVTPSGPSGSQPPITASVEVQ
jgi:hypothetical protein